MTAPKPSLNMRGKRFKPLDWGTMNAAQSRMVESVLAGKRGSMQGPYNVLLRSPELGDLAQKFGAHTRFNSSLPLALNELAILIVARTWTSQFVWWAHRAIALEAGLDRSLIDDIAAGRVPQGLAKLPAEVVAVYSFCSELQNNRIVSDASFAELVKHYGEAGVVDVMGTMSYYTLVSMALNVDQYPLPEGAQAELLPL
jgi:4-carboxymuconolactone decarboxylase